MGDALAKPWLFLTATAAFIVFAFTVLPAKAADAAAYTPPGASFDTSLFYAPAQAIERAVSYGEGGRAAYIYDRWTFDAAFPLVYGLFMLSAWAFSLKRLAPIGASPAGAPVADSPVGDAGAGKGKPRYGWLLVPALGIAFDFAENSAVTLLMLGVGSLGAEAALGSGAMVGALGVPPWLGLAAAASSASTALKWLFVGAGFAGAVALPALAGLGALRRLRPARRPG